ncbi:MAG TPA: pitrilysin family protein [Thermoanaerobaculia bacterium]|jgi:zinc protease|nr:pitrilysin family protein [Thermoanaerobaculia bacterium]
MKDRTHGRSASGAADVPRLPGTLALHRLDNGLTVGLLANRQAPVVTSALCYHAGTRDEEARHGGAAHFLEHMMFKGSAAYGPGEIDRRTQALGGANNAFTSHDATVYYFNFAADRWAEALAIEADRMAHLALDPAETASERQVILEEIAMYDSDPWDALEMATMARLFPDHAYGRPVLGTKESLLATGDADLRRFHRAFYRPDNATLIVAGDLGDDALDRVTAALGQLEAGAAAHPVLPQATFPQGLERLDRDKGEVPRLLLALPAPAASDPEHAIARLLADLLAGGRASQLHRRLVDELELCAWISADVSDNLDRGHFAITAELIPGVEPERAEAALFAELAIRVAAPPSEEELARARQIAIADWVFDHEKVHQQAVSAALSVALFTPDHHERQLAAMIEATPDDLLASAERWLHPERGAVLGWSYAR